MQLQQMQPQDYPKPQDQHALMQQDAPPFKKIRLVPQNQQQQHQQQQQAQQQMVPTSQQNMQPSQQHCPPVQQDNTTVVKHKNVQLQPLRIDTSRVSVLF